MGSRNLIGVELGRWGSRLGIRFPSVKLLDYAVRQAELEADENPFATVVLAHLAAQQTRGDSQARYSRKLRLTRRLYERGLSRQRIILETAVDRSEAYASDSLPGSLARSGTSPDG